MRHLSIMDRLARHEPTDLCRFPDDLLSAHSYCMTALWPAQEVHAVDKAEIRVLHQGGTDRASAPIKALLDTSPPAIASSMTAAEISSQDCAADSTGRWRRLKLAASPSTNDQDMDSAHSPPHQAPIITPPAVVCSRKAFQPRSSVFAFAPSLVFEVARMVWDEGNRHGS